MLADDDEGKRATALGLLEALSAFFVAADVAKDRKHASTCWDCIWSSNMGQQRADVCTHFASESASRSSRSSSQQQRQVVRA